MECIKNKVVYLKSGADLILISQEGLFAYSNSEGNNEFIIDLSQIVAIR